MIHQGRKNVAVIVAHPDDETLWAGATLLDHSLWKIFIASLSRKDDQERSAKFFRTLNVFGAEGLMNDMDDGPGQRRLTNQYVQDKILQILPHQKFDLIVTHSPNGEYTRHRRHEEVSKAVIKLWHLGKIHTDELWTFAYEDGNKAYYPRAIKNADFIYKPHLDSFRKKYDIITKIYGFSPKSWEAKTTPKQEAFWQFNHAQEAIEKLNNFIKEVK